MKNHYCAVDSLAYLLNTTREELLKTIGHNGDQIIFPTHPYPNNLRGFTPDELIKATVSFGGIPIFLPLTDQIGSMDGLHLHSVPRLMDLKTCPVNFVTFMYRIGGAGHSVAVKPGFSIYDPAKKLKHDFGPYHVDSILMVLDCWDDVERLRVYWKT